MSRCKGIVGSIFGHAWKVEAHPVPANHNGPGIFFMHGIGPLMIKRVSVCKRCKAVKEDV